MPAGEDHSYLQVDQRSGTAIVFLDQPPVFLAADSVLVDNRKGAAMGVRHLMSAGHRQIAYLGYREQTWTNRQRYSGYCDALRSRRLAIRPEVVRQGLVTSTLAEEATIELLSQARAPTALFTAQASITIGAVRALLSRQENHRTALVGFDDFETADLLDPGVTVVTHDPDTFGSLATEDFFDGSRATNRLRPNIYRR